ncbi:hypothetical protein [Gordonia sp. NPDC058843]|uniref:hypothetical protein n=1 Tax=Gordonia sp. NPDC058843 TaxID=3346648 RepID=UPI0007E388A2|nr:hypothetical protein [Gordonia sp. LAM0048]
MSTQFVSDTEFGDIVIERNRTAGTVTLQGVLVPDAVLTRTGSTTRSDVPIGTREAIDLRLTLGGSPVTLLPSRGRWSRRSYRILVKSADSAWLFTAATPYEHRLVRGEKYKGSNEIGLFKATGEDVAAEWSEQVRVAGRVVVEAPAPTAEDCSLGYLLAASFGTGARLLVPAVLEGIAEGLLPG